MKLNSLLFNAYKKNEKNSGDSAAAQIVDSDGEGAQFLKSSSAAQNAFQKKSENALGNPSASPRYSGDERVQAAARALTSGGLLKVPSLPRERDGRENVYRRVAKFLLLIGVDEAAKILPKLSEEQTERIIPEIASIQKVDPAEADEILSEFHSLMVRARDEGGSETAREMLVKAFGKEKAKKILDKAVESMPMGKPFEYLGEADGERVSVLLKEESNPVRALVLSYLKPKVAADVIKSLSKDDRQEVIMRLANLSKISPEVLKAVDKAMMEKNAKLNIQKADEIDGRATLAQILKRLDSSAEEEILDSLERNDLELGSDLRRRLFTLDDVVQSDDRFLESYLRKMDDVAVAYLITNKDDSFRGKILRNVSNSRGKSILEAEEYSKPMRKSDVEKVTSEFLTQMREAYERGDLAVSGRGGEYYV